MYKALFIPVSCILFVFCANYMCVCMYVYTYCIVKNFEGKKVWRKPMFDSERNLMDCWNNSPGKLFIAAGTIEISKKLWW